MDLLFGQSDEMSENQPTLGLDDGAGLRVVKARFVSQRKFDWELFAGYDQLRVLTYSASVNAIVRMLNQFSFSAFECVFGCEATLRDIKNVLAFQKVVIGDTRAAIMGLKDERHMRILESVQALMGAPMAAYSGCGERDGGIGHGKRRSRTGLARVCRDVGLAGGSVADGRRQAGSGMARSRARARLNCSSQGQRRGRCRVNRRAERVIRPAKAKTRRLRVLVVTIC